MSATTTAVRSQPRKSAPLRPLGIIGLLITVPAVAVITLWPTHFFLRAKPRVLRGLEWLHSQGVAEWLYWTRLEVLANVAMFAWLALLMSFVLGARRWWLTIALCVALSAGIELAQHLWLPGRVSTVRDVFANSAGAVLGVGIAALAEPVVRALRVPRPRIRHA